jgi:HlyD family secretion protein
MKRWFRRLVVPVVLVLLVLGLRATVFRPAPVSVTVYRADRGRVEETVVNSRAGTVESRRRAQMSPGVAGLVAEIPVEKGSPVERGQVLLRLDDAEHRAQVALSRRTLEAAGAAATQACLTAEQAARERTRAEGLAERDLISEQALEDARTRAGVAEAACVAARERVREAEAAVEVARALLDKTVMTAPFAGVVLDITTEVGEWISPSPPGVYIPPVVDVIDPEALYVTAPIDEADVSRLRAGLPVRITLDAFRGLEFPATITYVASFVETRQEQNRTLTVEADFAEPELPENLLPGLSADFEILLDAREDVLRIPTYALLEGNRVLVVRDGTLEEHPVDVGIRNWEFTQITSGLDAGDAVVVSLDRPEVRAGARARIGDETRP